MKALQLIFLLLFVQLNSIVRGQEKIYPEIIEQIRDEGFNRSKVDEYIWNISDHFGPRLPASTNIRNAQNWVLTTIEDLV